MSQVILSIDDESWKSGEETDILDYDIVNSTSVSQAFNLLEKHDIHLIVLNTSLLHKSDPNIFEKLRSLALLKGIYFIYLVGANDIIRYRRNYYCVEVMEKPVNRNRLVERIKLALIDRNKSPLYSGDLDELSVKNLLLACEQILFSGVIIVHCNLERAKLFIDNGRLVRVLLNLETDWLALDEVLTWRTGDFKIYGNSEKFSVRLFESLKNKKESIYMNLDSAQLNAIFKKIKMQLSDALGFALFTKDGQILVDHILSDDIKINTHKETIHDLIKKSRLLVLSLKSNFLDEIMITANKHQVLIRKVGKDKVFCLAYFRKTSQIGMAKLVIQGAENEILDLLNKSENSV
ncbi:MAG: DUF4388 domain-containing protein [Calditrichaeota bacterium]|nr:DUF4388 domain-containing protein [Calditrichota bacterium]